MHIDDIGVGDRIVLDGRIVKVVGFRIFESGRERVCVRGEAGEEQYVSARSLEPRPVVTLPESSRS